MKIESLTIISIIGPYCSTLAALTLIKLFFKMLIFSNIYFNEIKL